MKFNSVEQYLNVLPSDQRARVEELRSYLQKLLPEDAIEVISYNMPAFKLKKVIVYFAAHKEHIGFYPTAKPIEVFKDELADYKFSKGAIQFPYNRPMPEELIKKIVDFRLKDLGL